MCECEFFGDLTMTDNGLLCDGCRGVKPVSKVVRSIQSIALKALPALNLKPVMEDK